MIYNPDLQVSTQKAFADSLMRFGGKYKNVVVLTSNLSDMSVSQPFAKLYPDRCFHFGNAVDNMFAAACGFTVRGKLPIICTLALNAAGRGWDQISGYICAPNLNIKIVGLRSGLLNSEEGVPFQALEDVALMRNIPNMKVVCPADAVETKKAFESMLEDYGPTYMRLTHVPVPDLFDERYKFDFSKGYIYKPGSDVCIFAHGVALHMALDAALQLDRVGVSTMVVNMSSVAPLDENLVIECAKAVNHVVTVEDHGIGGGLGTAVMETLSANYPVKVLRIGMENFGESGKVDDLFRKYRLDAIGIAERIVTGFGLNEGV